MSATGASGLRVRSKMHEPDTKRRQVQALLGRYIEERLEGGSPDPAELCSDCPELRSTLERYVREFEELHDALAPSARFPASIAPTEDLPKGLLVPGQILGDRYQIRTRLGRGGMGEVWRAFDLKLRVEVALKALLPDRFKDERRRQLLRREVRAAREVVSPNVCRIFDLIEVDGVELVSMEYVDGGTLLSILAERSPLDLKEAQEIASQFLAGLEAIHQVDLVHRDVKPENIMITRSGRVVLMDFGLARGTESGAGTVSGTPAYMAPEQAAGLQVDARADLYSAGVVLAEMVSPEGVRDLESRQSVWEGIRQEPVELSDSPWTRVLEQAVAKDREQRYESARALNRALEDVTLRVEGAEHLNPYPGLAAFTEDDAEYFFGREAEVEAMWRRLEGASRMLGLIGPSGAGKTSFLRAGLLATKNPEWGHVLCTPGSDPRASLRRAVISSLESDTEALRELAVGGDDATVSAVSRWRQRHEHALVVVDQFEELFTQNTADEQERFSKLLGRLVLEADAFLLLCMRDDFLALCHAQEPLRPIFHELTVLDPPTGAGLGRALVQPATKCGYRFEDDALVEEMLAEVEGERGSLPLLAFSMARLWRKRDREEGVLTRRAYHDIGGVGGALARHAEATLERIGPDRIPLVRELFRNLVTAERTRAIQEWDELLSVFEEPVRDSAEEVLRQLVDARLLTSYEVRSDGEDSSRRVEIIHESLLVNWPRLVRWQTQDADAAQLRDELRQAARAWHEHGRSDDRLWSGSAYREFEIWRERYPGGLSDVEHAFSAAMEALANRRARRRRIALASVLVLAAVVIGVTTTLWRRSELEQRRAEAQKLFALAQLELDSDRTASLAYATKSLELADDTKVRQMAVEALWRGPIKSIIDQDPSWAVPFSADGRWLVKSEEVAEEGSHLEVVEADGGRRGFECIHAARRVNVSVCPNDELFASWDWSPDVTVALWSKSAPKPLATHHYDEVAGLLWTGWKERSLLVRVTEDDEVSIDVLEEDGSYRRLGTLGDEYARTPDISPTGRWVGAIHGDEVVLVDIGDSGLEAPRQVGVHSDADQVVFHPQDDFLATKSPNGEIRIWDPQGSSEAVMVLEGPSPLLFIGVSGDGSFLIGMSKADGGGAPTWIWDLSSEKPRLVRTYPHLRLRGFDPTGRKLASFSEMEKDLGLFLLATPPEAEPIPIEMYSWSNYFDPHGDWLTTTGDSGSLLWHVSRPFPVVIAREPHPAFNLEFEPHGRFLAASGGRNFWVRVWPLEGDVPAAARTTFEGLEGPQYVSHVSVSPDGRNLLVTRQWGQVSLVPASGGPVHQIAQAPYEAHVAALCPSGRLVAVPAGFWVAEPQAVHIWDVESGKHVESIPTGAKPYERSLYFLSEDQLLVATETALMKLSREGGASEKLLQGTFRQFDLSHDGRCAVLLEGEEPRGGLERAVVLDLETGETTPLASHGGGITAVAIDPKGSIAVTGNSDGEIRVGPISGEEPHLLLGHSDVVVCLAVDPLGRWIASGSLDGTVRLWPMPDLSKPPLHTLPREELIAKLETFTNVRVVRDEESSTGWILSHDPFSGWETVPSW